MASAHARARRAGPEVVSSSATPRVGRRRARGRPRRRDEPVGGGHPVGLRQPEPDDGSLPRGGDRASTSRRGEPTRWRRARRRRRRRPLSRRPLPGLRQPDTFARPDVVDALLRAGVEVIPTGDAPDAADIALGAHLTGFARARVPRSPTVPLPPLRPFLTPRAIAHARARAESEHPDDPSAPDLAEAALARGAARHAARVAKDLERRLFEDANVRIDEVVPAAVLVATSDNDIVPCVRDARRSVLAWSRAGYLPGVRAGRARARGRNVIVVARRVTSVSA